MVNPPVVMSSKRKTVQEIREKGRVIIMVLSNGIESTGHTTAWIS